MEFSISHGSYPPLRHSGKVKPLRPETAAGGNRSVLLERTASDAPLGDYEFNPNNFWSWVNLGTVLLQANLIDDAILRWKTASCMWPRGAKLYANRMIGRNSSDFRSSKANRIAREFWQSVTNDAVRNWCKEMAVELPESALTD